VEPEGRSACRICRRISGTDDFHIRRPVGRSSGTFTVEVLARDQRNDGQLSKTLVKVLLTQPNDGRLPGEGELTTAWSTIQWTTHFQDEDQLEAHVFIASGGPDECVLIDRIRIAREP
jgi:hypothetical protein